MLLSRGKTVVFLKRLAWKPGPGPALSPGEYRELTERKSPPSEALERNFPCQEKASERTSKKTTKNGPHFLRFCEISIEKPRRSQYYIDMCKK
jgi:hypothetical protein